MERNIGVEADELFALQIEVGKRLRDALKGGDLSLPKAIQAVLNATPGRRELLVQGRPFQREGAILARETHQLQKDIYISDKDPRAMTILHVDWDNIAYRSFTEGEETLMGDTKLSRMKKSGVIRLDWSWGQALKQDHNYYGSDSILEHLYRNKQIKRLDFFGTITKRHNPDRYDESYVYILYRSGNKDRGYWDFVRNSLTNGFDSESLSPIVELPK